MIRKNGLCTHNGILFTSKKVNYETCRKMDGSGKLTENEISQANALCSFICGSSLQIFSAVFLIWSQKGNQETSNQSSGEDMLRDRERMLRVEEKK